jgi:2',3'-cyclic-nucleotide 2'-phosphodiesterase (5'-nucleotidase family)
VILEALNSGVSRLPITAGQFPQVSGLTMSVDVKAAAGDRVHDVRIKGEPLEPQRIYSVALTDYQLQGGDSYGMFKDQPVLIGPEAGPLLVTALEKYIAAHGEVNPRLEGRIRISR